jgi:hypothetical protein
MKKNILKHFLFIFVILAMSSCKKNEQVTPETKKWSYSFNLNGVEYKDEGTRDDFPPIVRCSFTNTSYGGLQVSMMTGSLLQPNMLGITLPENSIVGTYRIDNKYTNKYSLMRYYAPAFGWTYSTSEVGAYAVVIIKSVTSDLVIGTFSGKLYDGNQIVSITSGNFQALLEE